MIKIFQKNTIHIVLDTNCFITGAEDKLLRPADLPRDFQTIHLSLSAQQLLAKGF